MLAHPSDVSSLRIWRRPVLEVTLLLLASSEMLCPGRQRGFSSESKADEYFCSCLGIRHVSSPIFGLNLDIVSDPDDRIKERTGSTVVMSKEPSSTGALRKRGCIMFGDAINGIIG